MAADAADQDILDAELVDDDAVDWSGTALLPASTRSHHPRYLVDRHTVLAPGELPPTAEDQPRYTEADFRISADTAQRRARAGADNTRINRAAAIRRFEQWCAAEGRVARPCTDATYLEYAAHLMRQQPSPKADTINTYMGHIWRWQPPGRRPERDETLALLDTYRRENPRTNRKKQAPALQLSDVLAMIDACDESTPTGQRDVVLLGMMYQMLGRRSEPAAVDIEYLEVLDHQVVIDLEMDKTHQDGEGLDLIRLHDRPDTQLVRRTRTWLAWLRQQGITNGPLLRQLSVAHNLTKRARSAGPEARLSPAAIGERIKVLAANAGIRKPATITSQGIRAGASTDLAEHGVRGKQLARAGRWRDDSAIPEQVYVRPLIDPAVDPFAAVPAARPGEPAQEAPAPA
ncbi:integrase [Kitasatospora sp. MAA19]|uniref:tyrosine-type recombinase/integrase n=1 Tax=unclassified Kitasatospora TaxID=2633591 RepID=UPI0024745F3D|nr:tyrosine-type recombinase/integrase [Kitasatospora sp. MAA19]MDH6710750.1 integrase [Kitasatospora sp. MAA19]